jgi:hypothetical protein
MTGSNSFQFVTISILDDYKIADVIQHGYEPVTVISKFLKDL